MTIDGDTSLPVFTGAGGAGGAGGDGGDEFPIAADPKLEAEGWVRRHLADPARAEEAMELYQSMGFEVHARQLTPDDFGPDCRACAVEVCSSYVLIYTRRGHGPGNE